jgi:hypothetical protein
VAGAVGGQRAAAVRGLEGGGPVVPPGVDADVPAHLGRVDVEARVVLTACDREGPVARARVDDLDPGALGLRRHVRGRRLLPRHDDGLPAAVGEGEPGRLERVVRSRAGPHDHDPLVPLAVGVGLRGVRDDLPDAHPVGVDRVDLVRPVGPAGHRVHVGREIAHPDRRVAPVDDRARLARLEDAHAHDPVEDDVSPAGARCRPGRSAPTRGRWRRPGGRRARPGRRRRPRRRGRPARHRRRARPPGPPRRRPRRAPTAAAAAAGRSSRRAASRPRRHRSGAARGRPRRG